MRVDGRRLLALLNAALLLASTVVVAQDAARAQARTGDLAAQARTDVIDFGGVGVGHNNTGMANVQNLTTAAPEDSTGYGPVDQRRIEGIKDLLSHLNFIDLQLSQLDDSGADSFASPPAPTGRASSEVATSGNATPAHQ